MDVPTTVEPWPRMSTQVQLPKDLANDLPRALLLISMSVLPPSSRISKCEEPSPKKPAM